jgi:hypothetical protein
MKRRGLRRRSPWRIDPVDATLLELVDRTLNQGVTVMGELVLSLAEVELVYLRLGLLLCAADRCRPAPRKVAA